MSKFSMWGATMPHEESNVDSTDHNKEKLGEQKIMKSNVLVTAKIRKLMLRLELWNIYEIVFLNKDTVNQNKNRAAASMLDDALEGQKQAQKRIATIFSSDSTIENWESVLSKLKFFEDESDTIPLVSGTEDSTIPLTELSVSVKTSDDQFIKDTVLNFSTDPHQVACEIQVEYRLPAEEIDYIQGMLQHGKQTQTPVPTSPVLLRCITLACSPLPQHRKCFIALFQLCHQYVSYLLIVTFIYILYTINVCACQFTNVCMLRNARSRSPRHDRSARCGDMHALYCAEI